MELRRLELEIAKELKKPNEDMCLADHKVFTIHRRSQFSSPAESEIWGRICIKTLTSYPEIAHVAHI